MRSVLITNLKMSTQYEPIELVHQCKTEIRYVYHMSDIHIRNLARHDEYNMVFNEVYKKIKKNSQENKDESIIVLTGDIMHSKTELSPEAFDMAYNFFNNLSQILPVILIAGNHDCSVTNIDRMDALSPIIENCYNIENIFYLKNTGLYNFNNIIFGVTDIYTNEPLLSDNITIKMMNQLKHKNTYKIALFHGPIRESKTDTGYEMKSERFRGKDFRGYDYAFFGDIHKFQYLNKNKTFAYAGSLIQQSFGETLDKHGILKWDLLTGKSKLIEIKNDYGFCTINVVNGQMIDEIIPKNPRIKFILENTTQQQFQEIQENIKKTYSICDIISENKISPNNPILLGNDDDTIATFDHNKLIRTYIKKKLLDNNLSKSVYKLHEKIYEKIVNESEKIYTTVGGRCWKIHELKFSNIFSYGEDNVINFDNYNKNQIIGIVAPNHYGKSAVLDIILYCLFETSTRGKAINIMNKDEKIMKCSLLFSIGSTKYLIERSAVRGANDKRMKLDVNFTKLTKTKSKNLNGIRKNDTNNYIINLIGTYDDYLTSYICTQENDKYGNFINKTNLKKKEYLYEILKLDIFDHCFNHAKEKIKEFTITIKNLNKEIDQIPIKSIQKEIHDLNSKLCSYLAKKTHLLNLRRLVTLSLQFIKEPILVKYNELSSYNLSTLDNITETINSLNEQLADNNTSQIKNIIKDSQLSLLKLEHEYSDNDEIYSLNNELELLYSKIINYPNDESIDIDNLILESEQLKTHISKINNEIASLESQLESCDDLHMQLNQSQRELLQHELKILKEFKEHVTTTLKKLGKYSGMDNVINIQNNWLNNYNIRKQEIESMLCYETVDVHKIKHRIDTLINKKESFDNKLEHLTNNIKTQKTHQKYILSNNKIYSEINSLKEKIKVITDNKNIIKEKIKQYRKTISDNTKLLKKYGQYEVHIRLLEDYSMLYRDYILKKESYNHVINNCNYIDTKIKNIDRKIMNIKYKLSDVKKSFKKYTKINDNLDAIKEKMNIYEIYSQFVNSNGIPYEILKTFLPIIETKVNQILHNIVNFNVEFVFYNGTITDKPNKNTKAQQNAIDINLQYNNQKSYNVELASGFEKFIIGLTIRMVLCNISKSAKPNFFIIDEGWSCLDNENLSNINTIMTYIKNQFEHVIIISHLDAIKEQSDYVINIDKKDNYSYIRNI